MKALIIIDMLEEFVNGRLGSEDARAIVPKIQHLIRIYRANDLPIAWACDEHYEDDPELAIWGPHAMAGMPGAQIIPELAPNKYGMKTDKERVFLKNKYGAFSTRNSGLGTWLHNHVVSGVVLVGTATHICVQHTAYEAMVRGFKVTVVEDATSAFPMPPYEATAVKVYALDYMESIYGAKTIKTKELT